MRLRLVVLVVVVAAIAALVTAAALGAFASGPSRTASGPTGLRSGLKVHGEWKLVVRNPDGRIVSVRRFHNDPLQANKAITTILEQIYASGLWWLELNSSTGAGPACVLSGAPARCLLFEPSDGSFIAASANAFKTLSVPNTCCDTSIVMNGSMTAQRDGDVNFVESNLFVCSPATAPSSCTNSGAYWPFTSRTLNSPVSLVKGQQLLVTLTLTFS